MSDEKKYFRLSDQSIGQIANLLQVAILTGTDVIDHMRMIVFEADEKGSLVPTDEYQEVFDETIEKMLRNVEEQKALSGQETPEA